MTSTATSIRLRSVSKRFGGHAVVDEVALDIAAGEFVALLGPSGCGKTTLLRMIAGFERLDGGAIHFGDRLIADDRVHMVPEERNVAIVFQSYALWPHMSVGQNVGYPLRVRGLKRSDQAERIAQALAAVDLAGFESRRPADLSGGQRQRVALARCFAMDPSIVLLDEPLANLDIHLRASMEETFKRFHERTGATMVYVTHDQSEAMAMADRIAVMQEGRILETAAPAALYATPGSEAVARFVGNGHVVDCEVLDLADADICRVRVFGLEADIRHGGALPCPPEPGRLCLRAEGLSLVEGGGFRARVLSSTFKGAHSLLIVEPAEGPGLTLPLLSPVPRMAGTSVRVAIRDGWLLPPTGASFRPERLFQTGASSLSRSRAARRPADAAREDLSSA